jgi:hypothetical protein
MLIGAAALSSCFATSPLGCSTSDMIRSLSAEVDGFK